MIINLVMSGYKMKDKDIYSKKGADDYVDEDIISSEEHGFMIGYLCAM